MSEELRPESIFKGGKKGKRKKPFGLSAFIYTSFFFFSQLSNINKMTCAFSRGNWRKRQTRRAGETKVVGADGKWRGRKDCKPDRGTRMED